jgi:hypothetical protein
MHADKRRFIKEQNPLFQTQMNADKRGFFKEQIL